MNYYLKFICYISITIISLASCMLPVTQPKVLDCPIPSQDCQQGLWKGISLDTTVESSKLIGFYYKIEMVNQINSPDDEWSLSFLNDKIAALTYTDVDRQTMMLMRMLKPNKFSLESGLYSPFETTSGSLSIRGNKAVLAAVPDNPDKYSGAVTEEYEESKREAFEDIESGKFKERYGTDIRDERAIAMIKIPNEYIMGNSNLYIADLSGNILSNAGYLGKKVHSSTLTWESHPTLSPDGNVIFFSSDKPGGLGGTDIWFTYRLPEGSWSEPVNAGSTINSKCDDITPFITQDGKKLYFSSAGHDNVGGYDLFTADFLPAFWNDVKYNDTASLYSKEYFEKLKNLRAPLNTVYDEIFPSSPGNPDSILYYSSNQYASTASIIERKGGFDIFVKYKVKSPYIEEYAGRRRDKVEIGSDEPTLDNTSPDLSKVPLFTLEGKVLNSSTNEPVKDAEVVVRELPNFEVRRQTTSNDQGDYRVDLEKDREFEVTAQAKDLFFDTFKLRVDKEDPTATVKHDFKLPMKFELRVNFPLDIYKEPYKYTLDSNGIETSRGWEQEIELLVANINMSKDKIQKLILVGHTDYLASDEYNLKLGKRRVDFIINELIKRGVPAELLEGRSAGESEQLVKRKGEDENLYRKRLRRVTLEKVMKL